MPLTVGTTAPDFALQNAKGETVHLADFLGKKNVVLFFYPKDDTPGCTIEACTFRDQYDAFATAGAEVIGVSADSASSHARFASKHSLPMTLLSDEDGSARALYGVKKKLGFIPSRITFVIDRKGVVQHVTDSSLGFKEHVHASLEVLKRLDATEARGAS